MEVRGKGVEVEAGGGDGKETRRIERRGRDRERVGVGGAQDVRGKGVGGAADRGGGEDGEEGDEGEEYHRCSK